MKMNRKNLIRLGIVLIAAVAAILLIILPRKTETQKADGTAEIKQDTVIVPEEIKKPGNINLQECVEINSDVKAVLRFESGLLEQPVVQAGDNDHYLYTDWKTGEYSELGSIVLDYENRLENDDMNTILYGHYVYPEYSEDRTLMFTPLDLLKDPDNYEENQFLDLETENDIRKYQIVCVFQCPVEDIGGIKYPIMSMQYNLVNYDEDYFELYLNEIHAHEYFSSGTECTYGDKLLTLQTCVEGDETSREVILCKEISKEEKH